MRPAQELVSLQEPFSGVILVDVSWLVNKSYYAYSKLTKTIGGVEVPTGDIYGFIRAVLDLSRIKPCFSIILCYDSPSFRADMYPEYKGGRDSKPEVYQKLGEITQAVSYLPHVYLAQMESFEADDLIFSLARTFSPLMKHVWIFSSDRDLYQALDDNVSQFSKIKKGEFDQVITPAEVEKKFSVLPRNLVMFRALKGDTSDNLPGYKGLYKKVAKKIAEGFDSPVEFFEKNTAVVWEKSETKWINKILGDKDILERNYVLMRLRTIKENFVFEAEGNLEPLKKYGMQNTLYKEVVDIRYAYDKQAKQANS